MRYVHICNYSEEIARLHKGLFIRNQIHHLELFLENGILRVTKEFYKRKEETRKRGYKNVFYEILHKINYMHLCQNGYR